MRKFKTAEDNRTNYIYYFNDGTSYTITPGENGENATIISQLHGMDDDELDADRREAYHCPIHYDGYHDGDGDDADDRNPYLEDETYNPLAQILTSIANEERSLQIEKLKVALSQLTDKQKDTIVKKFYRGMTNVQIAAEEGVSEAAIRNRLTVNKEEKPKLKVAAYCRVSTDSDEQATSYEAQVEHYTDFIKKNPEWEFAGIFADDGITGTNTKKREEFNRMIDEAMAGRIDMIITKSISRFARNTLDCLKYIRQLKEKNIPVYFEKENINTMDAKGEVLLTIMASLAQQESQSLSQNVKLGFQYRYQQGQMTVNHNRFLGFTKDEKGQLIVEPDEAVVVKRIYREYLEGASLQQIGRGLEADGILTGAGKKKWRPETLQKILKNEKYIGDALLQKTYTVDFLEKKRVPNNGLVPQYYVENSHEAIIPRDLYMQVQEEMIRRANLHSGQDRKKRVYSSKYALSSIVYCSKCGDIYRRIAWNNRGKHSIVWRCCTRVEHGPGACDADTIQESELQNLTVRAINMALGKKESMSETLQKNVEAVLTGADGIPLDEIDSRLEQLQKELLKVANAKGNYDSIADEIYHLREIKQNALVDNAEREGMKQRISEMQQFLSEQTQEITEYDEQLVRRLIEKITVYEEKVTVEFKSGTRVDVRR